MWSVKCLVFLVCGLNVLCDQNVKESEIDGSLSENIVLYGMISELAERNTNVSATCATDLTSILRSINKLDMWALKVMDASGTYRENFIWGQNAWIGSKQSCDFLNQAPKFTTSSDILKLMDKNLISTIPPMQMDFKIIFSNIVSPYKVDRLFRPNYPVNHRLGLCLPKSCSNQDIERLSKNFFSRQKLRFQRTYNATVDVVNVRNMDFRNFLSRPEATAIFLAICFVVALVVLFSFGNKVFEKSNREGPKRFLKCFSIYDNVTSIYNTNSSPTSINSLNGMRSLICLWVVYIHCGFLNLYAYDNLPVLLANAERISYQPAFGILLYLDVFFALSALLLVYNFLKDERTLTEVRNNSIIGNVKFYCKKLLHRYIRLTPALIFTAGVSHILSIYIQESSSFYIDETFDAYCTPYSFLSSMLYIQNIFEVDNMCMTWSWYLACDMQFYVIVMLILFVYVRYPTIAKIVLIALLAAVTVASVYLNVGINLLMRFDSIFNHVNEFYIQPWHRMNPYLAGSVVGYIMFQIRDKKYPENRYITVFYWTVTCIIIIGTLFLTSFKDSSASNFALTMPFARLFMGLFVGSWVVMCRFGYGGIVNTFLSSKFFVHFNKVTYTMYLIHPVIILLFNSTQESSPHFDVSSITSTAFAVTLLSYAAAVVISPVFELPFQKLSDEYIIKKRKK